MTAGESKLQAAHPKHGIGCAGHSVALQACMAC